MESKNPLEEIRTAILESQLFGLENEITQLGVSDELLRISDALDKYYGIEREPKDRPIGKRHVLNNYNVYTIEPSPYISSVVGNIFGESRFAKTKGLLKQVKEPLKSIKGKLSKDDPVYLNLSSAIVSIALHNVVSAVNSYQKPAYYDYKRYDPISGIDNVFGDLIYGGLDVFNELNNFDMTNECLENYEANRKTIFSMAESIREAMLNPRSSSSSKSGSSGCMVLTLAISTSIMACLGTIIFILVNN